MNGTLADTTFPSKVIEYVSNELTLITTDISDVRAVLLSDPYYITNDDPIEIVGALESYIKSIEARRQIALNAKMRLTDKLSLENVFVTVRNTRAAEHNLAPLPATLHAPPQNLFYRNKPHHNLKASSAPKLDAPDEPREQQAKCGAQHVGPPVVEVCTAPEVRLDELNGPTKTRGTYE